MKKPKISVLMPVLNGERYIKTAIDSILNQTYKDFELIIIDDGKDGSEAVVKSYDDPRIRYIHKRTGEKNLIGALNYGLKIAHGEYIARMDCDDISLPERFQIQIDFMEKHPEVGVCGTWYEFIEKDPKIVIHPSTHEEIKEALLHIGSVIAHPTVIIRNKVLRESKIRYDPDYPYAEDYKFWIDLSKVTYLANIPKVLLRYRLHKEQSSVIFQKQQSHTLAKIKLYLIGDIFCEVPKKYKPVLNQYFFNEYKLSIKFLTRLAEALIFLDKKNRELKYYSPANYTLLLDWYYFSMCYVSIDTLSSVKVAHVYLNFVVRALGEFRVNFKLMKNFYKIAKKTMKKILFRYKIFRIFVLPFEIKKSRALQILKKRPEIIVQVEGNLGNQLFQFASAFALSRKYNIPLTFSTYVLPFQDNREFYVGVLCPKCPVINRSIYDYCGKSSGIYSLQKIKPNLIFKKLNYSNYSNDIKEFSFKKKFYLLNGDWTREKIFKEYKSELEDTITREVSFSGDRLSVLNICMEENSVGVFVTEPEFKVLNSTERITNYYNNALKKFTKFHNKYHYIIFCKNKNLAKRLQLLKGNKVEIVEDPNIENSFEMLALLAKCKHKIIASGKFSWWAAWLYDNSEKKVFYPKDINKINNVDLNINYPQHWKEITCK